MAKVVLTDIASLANNASAKAALNDNSAALEAAMENTVSRDGTGPNAMAADFDMGENHILNVADPIAELDAVNKRSVKALVDERAGEIAELIIEGTNRVDVFTATSGQQDFVLTDSPGTVNNLWVLDQNIVLTPTVDYTLIGSDLKTLHFHTGRLLNNEIVARYVKLGPTDSVLRADLGNSTSGKGSDIIHFKQSGTGAVNRLLSDKVKEIVVTPEDFGALGDGVTNDQAAITAAITEVATRGGGTVKFAAKDYAVSSKVAPTSGVRLIGEGAGQYPASAFIESANFIATPKTRILAKAGFPADTAVIECKPAIDPLYTHHGMAIQGIMVDCANIANRGIDVISVKNSYFRDILVFRPISVGINEDVLPVADGATEGNNATQFNRWEDISIWGGNTGSAVGWKQNGTTVNNVNQSLYSVIKIVHADGDAIQILNGDTNVWTHVNTFSFGAGFGLTLAGHATDPNITARNNTFFGVQFSGPGAGNGGVRTTNPGSPPLQNRIYGHSSGNGSPDPIIANGSRLNWSPDIGEYVSDPVEVKLNMQRTDSWLNGPVGGMQMIARLTGSSTDTNVGYFRMLAQGGAGTESTRWEWHTYQSGAQAIRGYIANGLVMGSPTGGDKGAGTINAQAVYDDNIILTDYVFDVLLDGSVKPQDGAKAEKFDVSMLIPEKYGDFWKEYRHLPSMPSREDWLKDGKYSTGDLIQRLWEAVEVQAVHIDYLLSELKKK